MIASLDDIQPDRPLRVKYDHDAIARARARGVSWNQIADWYGVSSNAARVAHHLYAKARKAFK